MIIRKRHKRVLLTAALLGLALLHFPQSSIAEESRLLLKETLQCRAPVVSLVDLLDGSLPSSMNDLLVCKSPEPGKTRSLSRRRLQRLLREEGYLGRLEGAETVKISTPSLRLSSKRILEPASRYLDRKLEPLGLKRISPLMGFPEEIQLSDLRIEFEMELQGETKRQGEALLKVRDSLGFEIQRRVSFRCEKPIRVPVCRHPQVRGETLRNWGWEVRNLFDIDGQPLEEGALSTAVLKRRLEPGDVLTTRNTESDLLVRAGREVVIQLERGAVRVRKSGVAQSNGRYGEMVPVRLRDSRELKRYRVAGPGLLVPSWIELREKQT